MRLRIFRVVSCLSVLSRSLRKQLGLGRITALGGDPTRRDRLVHEIQTGVTERAMTGGYYLNERLGQKIPRPVLVLYLELKAPIQLNLQGCTCSSNRPIHTGWGSPNL